MRRSSFAWLVLFAGCAQDLPGAGQPADQLYFPQGILRVQEGGGDFLVVASTNFDQRYNTGRLTTFDLAALFEATRISRDQAVLFRTDYAGAIRSSIRIDTFPGELAYIPGSDPRPGQVFVVTRFRNLLMMIDVMADGTLRCDNGGTETDFRFDCTPERFASTESEDPFALAVASLTKDGVDEQIIGVGHLRSTATGTQVPFQRVSLVRRADFVARLTGDQPGVSEDGDVVWSQRFNDFGGVSSMVYIPDDVTEIEGGQGAFLTLDRTRTPDVDLTTFALDFRTEAGTVDGTRPTSFLGVTRLSPRLSLVAETRALRSRGLRFDPGDFFDPGSAGRKLPPRVYASLGFQETADSFNSAIAVIDPTGRRPRFVSAFEIGDELGPPAVLRRGDRRFLYVPDLRLNRIYVLDASSDDLRPVAAISGAVERVQGGERFVAGGLSAPARIAIVERPQDNRTLGFVTNFLNSTLAVLDLTDPNPRQHRLIARFGQAIDAFGEPEGP